MATTDVNSPKLRVRVFQPNSPLTTATVTVDAGRPGDVSTYFAAKEWSLTDDVMNIADAASFTVANDDGLASDGAFALGQRVELDEAAPDVANGSYVRMFTGRVTSIESAVDLSGGSVVLVGCMDLGWHLTSSHGKPLTEIKNKTFRQLLDLLVDPSWGFAATRSDNDLNRRLKHGRQVVIQQSGQAVLGNVLPRIQVEPGQTPFDLIHTYAAREGVLVNVGADGGLIFFRPRYDSEALYEAQYHRDSRRSKNNVSGRPSLKQTIDELYGEVECWSTVVIPAALQNTENPNAQYRHSVVTASPNPLPFARRWVVSDGEAINDTLRKMRATFKQQMGLFNGWRYDLEFQTHSQDGAFFVSDTMMTVDDSVNKVSGSYYVQSVQRSQTLSGSTAARLVLRKPGLLNPGLQALGGGARKAHG